MSYSSPFLVKRLFPIAYTILLFLRSASHSFFYSEISASKIIVSPIRILLVLLHSFKTKKDDSHTIAREYKNTIHSTDITSTSTPNKALAYLVIQLID